MAVALEIVVCSTAIPWTYIYLKLLRISTFLCTELDFLFPFPRFGTYDDIVGAVVSGQHWLS